MDPLAGSDLPGGDIRNGNQLWLWECNGSDDQKWQLDGQLIRLVADPTYCMDLPGGDVRVYMESNSASRLSAPSPAEDRPGQDSTHPPHRM